MTLKEFKMQSALGSLTNTAKREMAEDPNTPIDILVKLSTDRSRYIRRRVAMNINVSAIPERDLIKLANDKSYEVKTQVASNPNTPTKVLNEILFTTKNVSIRYAIELNPNTSKEVMLKLKMENLKNILKKRRKKNIMRKIYGWNK